MTVNLRSFDTPSQWADAVALDIVNALNADIAKTGRAALALPGGRTPLTIVPKLIERDTDWSCVTVTLTDERWVETDHPDSNQRQTLDLLGPIADQVHFVGLKTEDAEKRIQNLLPFSCVLLGLGEDGHTASLFPGQELLPGVAQFTQGPDHRRISLTLDTLLSAKQIVLAAQGAEKRTVIEQAQDPARPYPISHILVQDRTPVSVLIC